VEGNTAVSKVTPTIQSDVLRSITVTDSRVKHFDDNTVHKQSKQ